MARIYAEMLVMDQWIAENPKLRTQADTSLVYEPILNEYGYTTEDYRASVSHYMKDPERYSRILRSTTELLEEELLELKELKQKEDRMKSVTTYELDKRWLYYNTFIEGRWETGDSVSVELDSLLPVYVMSFHQTSDTTYDGLNIVIREKADSVAVKKDAPKKDAVNKDAVKKEAPKVESKEAPKETPKEAPKETPKEAPKVETKTTPKETPKEIKVDAEKQLRPALKKNIEPEKVVPVKSNDLGIKNQRLFSTMADSLKRK